MSILTPIQARLTDAELDALDGFRRAHKDPPTRAQAARELIRRGLDRGNSTEAEHRKQPHAAASPAAAAAVA
jgi:hypothetical protein